MASSLNTPIDVDSEVAMATVSAEDPGAKRQSQRKISFYMRKLALDEEMMDAEENESKRLKLSPVGSGGGGGGGMMPMPAPMQAYGGDSMAGSPAASSARTLDWGGGGMAATFPPRADTHHTEPGENPFAAAARPVTESVAAPLSPMSPEVDMHTHRSPPGTAGTACTESPPAGGGLFSPGFDDDSPSSVRSGSPVRNMREMREPRTTVKPKLKRTLSIPRSFLGDGMGGMGGGAGGAAGGGSYESNRFNEQFETHDTLGKGRYVTASHEQIWRVANAPLRLAVSEHATSASTKSMAAGMRSRKVTARSAVPGIGSAC
jgi:hypothetical protein